MEASPPDQPDGMSGTSLWERLDGIDAEITALTGRTARVENGLEQMRTDLDDFEVRADELAIPAPDPDGPHAAAERPAEPPPLDMRVLVPWVRENLALVFQRRIPQTTAPHWCRQWWRHPEAIVRFEALRRSWLVAVSEPGAAMANYLSQVDQHLTVLMGEHGPFAGCTAGQHKPDSQARYLGQDDPDELLYPVLDTPP